MRLSVSVLMFVMMCLNSPSSMASEKRIDQFIEIALGNEYRSQMSNLRRWKNSIEVKLHQSVNLSPSLIALIDEHLALLSRATKHPISRVNTEANVHLYLIKQSLFSQTWRTYAQGNLPEDALCAAQITTDLNDQITQAVIVIPVDRASQQGRLLSCLVEELTQVTGLVNDSVNVYPSIFNDRSTDQMITPLDWMFLQTLYHSRLTPGMSETTVRPIVKDILTDAFMEQSLNDGLKHILQSNLFPLLSID